MAQATLAKLAKWPSQALIKKSMLIKEDQVFFDVMSPFRRIIYGTSWDGSRLLIDVEFDITIWKVQVQPRLPT